MRVHQFLVIEIVDVDPLFEPLMLLVVLNQVLQEYVYVALAVLTVADQDPRHYLERLLRCQHLIANFVLKQIQDDLQGTELLQIAIILTHLVRKNTVDNGPGPP